MADRADIVVLPGGGAAIAVTIHPHQPLKDEPEVVEKHINILIERYHPIWPIIQPVRRKHVRDRNPNGFINILDYFAEILLGPKAVDRHLWVLAVSYAPATAQSLADRPAQGPNIITGQALRKAYVVRVRQHPQGQEADGEFRPAKGPSQGFAAAGKPVDGISIDVPVNPRIQRVPGLGEGDAVIGEPSLFKATLSPNLLHLGFGEVLEDDPLALIRLAGEAQDDEIDLGMSLEGVAKFFQGRLGQEVEAAAQAQNAVATGEAVITAATKIVLGLVAGHGNDTRRQAVVHEGLLALPIARFAVREIVIDSPIHVAQESLLRDGQAAEVV